MQKYLSRTTPFEFKEYPIGSENSFYKDILHKPYLSELNKLNPNITKKKFIGATGEYQGAVLMFDECVYLGIFDKGVTLNDRFAISSSVNTTIPALFGIDHISFYRSILQKMSKNFTLTICNEDYDEYKEIETLKNNIDMVNLTAKMQTQRIKDLESLVRKLHDELNEKDKIISELSSKLHNY